MCGFLYTFVAPLLYTVDDVPRSMFSQPTVLTHVSYEDDRVALADAKTSTLYKTKHVPSTSSAPCSCSSSPCVSCLRVMLTNMASRLLSENTDWMYSHRLTSIAPLQENRTETRTLTLRLNVLVPRDDYTTLAV